MKTYQILGLEKPVTRLVMGSDYFSPERYDQVSEMLDLFVSLGGNTIDTAAIYGAGKSEQAIGQWLSERKNREQIVILTKGAHHDEHGPRVNREAILYDLESSLERLQTDYIDLYALHRDDPNVEVGEIIEVLNELKESGKIRAFGGSNWTVRRFEEANEYARRNGLTGFTFSSPNLSLAKAKEPFWKDCVHVDEETLRWHEQTQFPLISWSSQARGFFTGRYSPDKPDNPDLVRVFYSEENWARYDRAGELAEKKGVSRIQIALAYVLNQAFPVCAIIGPQNREEMESCFAAERIVLTPEEIRWLEHGE